jgi:trans-aconitate 2-methyltransferase
MSQTWNPEQYNAFAAERELPFWDLAGLIDPVESPAVVDLGCGDGRLTAALHGRLGARVAVGIDSSPAMLAKAEAHAGAEISFEAGDIAQWQGTDQDVVFSNAAMQWVGDHPAVLRRWREALGPNGQLAVQVPANGDHVSHRVSRELGTEWLGEAAPADPVAGNVLSPEIYARLLAQLDFERQHVRLQVYTHTLASSADVVEWVKGTSLTRFKAVLEPDDYERFVEEYRLRLLTELGDYAPYLYTFKRILMWGRLG